MKKYEFWPYLRINKERARGGVTLTSEQRMSCARELQPPLVDPKQYYQYCFGTAVQPLPVIQNGQWKYSGGSRWMADAVIIPLYCYLTISKVLWPLTSNIYPTQPHVECMFMTIFWAIVLARSHRLFEVGFFSTFRSVALLMPQWFGTLTYDLQNRMNLSLNQFGHVVWSLKKIPVEG